MVKIDPKGDSKGQFKFICRILLTNTGVLSVINVQNMFEHQLWVPRGTNWQKTDIRETLPIFS